jgi:CRISPR/Cas system-associated exonuclease Cas4 (RecB family)
MKRVRLGVTDVTDFSCPRRIVLSTLLAASGKKSEFTQSSAALKGKILHQVIQHTFRWNFDYVKHFYHSGLSEVESLENAMQSTLESWKNILISMRFKNLDRQSILDAITSAEDDIFSLSKVSQGAIYKTESSIESLVVSDEYNVVHEVNNYITLVGKVDLLLYRNSKLVVVELKTGRKYDTDSWQIQLYGDMIALNHGSSSDIEMELWYPQSKKVIPITHTNGVVLQQLTTMLSNIQSIESEQDLPSPKTGVCGYCNLCERIEDIFL